MSTNQERPAGEAGRIRVFDTTLRDGEQTPGVHITADQKAAVAERLEAFGVTTIEAGFPASSPGEFEAVGRVARIVKQCEVAALARCVREDIDAVYRDFLRVADRVPGAVSDAELEATIRGALSCAGD